MENRKDTDKYFPESGIEVFELIRIIAYNWKFIMLTFILTMSIGILYILASEPKYEATTTVQILDDSGGSAASALKGLAGLGDLASLAGISLGGDANRGEFLSILKSRALAEQFIREMALEAIIFPERWDEQTGSWKHGGLVWKARNAIAKVVAQITGDKGWKPRSSMRPTPEELFRRFDDDIRFVREDRDTGLVRVSMVLPDPVIAKDFANRYVAFANEVIRAKIIIENKKMLSYLDSELRKTSSPRLLSSFSAIIESKIQEIALANSRDDYPFRIIDPAFLPERPAYPDRAGVMVVFAVLGIFLGIVGALWRFMARWRRAQAEQARGAAT